ncbi:MAG: acylphosphatase [Candidatus Chromulinivorax sp.]|nr:acylphosphatase [Candidatus Chromulinivorax sp.]
MKKCVKISFEIEDAQKILETFVAKQAEKFGIEGVGQQIKKGLIQLYACAQEEQVDEFIDSLYVGMPKVQLKNIKIETCPTDRSYRGVFRIVE